MWLHIHAGIKGKHVSERGPWVTSCIVSMTYPFLENSQVSSVLVKIHFPKSMSSVSHNTWIIHITSTRYVNTRIYMIYINSCTWVPGSLNSVDATDSLVVNARRSYWHRVAHSKPQVWCELVLYDIWLNVPRIDVKRGGLNLLLSFNRNIYATWQNILEND